MEHLERIASRLAAMGEIDDASLIRAAMQYIEAARSLIPKLQNQVIMAEQSRTDE